MKFGLMAVSAVLSMAALPLSQALAGDAVGTWIMDNGKVTVRISECGSSLCGTIVGMKKPLDKNGKPKRDKDNPNPSLRNRPVIGLTILSNMKPDGSDKWKGTIYNPDDGSTYSSYMKLSGDSVMKVHGCVAVICKGMTFRKVN